MRFADKSTELHLSCHHHKRSIANPVFYVGMRLYRDFEESLTTRNPVVFDKHLGVILLDAIFQSFLLGIVFSQAARYWYERGDDALKKKAFVLTICLFTLYVLAIIVLR